MAYICSFPKCGRTWVQHVLAHVINDTEQRGIDVNTKTMFDLVPVAFHQRNGAVGTVVSDHPLPLLGPLPKGVYLDHTHWCKRFENENVVLLVRCPLDTLVSLYHHTTSNVPCYFGSPRTTLTLSQAITTRARGLAEYYRSWEPHVENENVLVVRYEDLFADPVHFVQVVDHVGISCSPSQVLQAVEASTANKMREEERQHGLGQGIPGRRATSINEFRVRLARPGSWREDLIEAPKLPSFALLERYGYEPVVRSGSG